LNPTGIVHSLMGSNQLEKSFNMSEKLSNPLFISIPIPAEISVLLESVGEIEMHNELIRWTPLENYHITLLYLGRVETALLPGMQTILRKVFEDLGSFKLSFEKLVFMPKTESPKMLWAQFEENEDVNHCSNLIREALKPLIQVESRYEKLIPHILLARIKRRAIFDQSSLILPKGDFNIPVNSCELRESNQSDRGVYYKKLLGFELQ